MLMRSFVVAGFAAMLAGPALAHAQDAQATHFGTYEYVKGMNGTNEVPAENLKGQTVKIEEKQVTLLDASGAMTFTITFQVDDDSGENTKFSMEVVKSVMEDAVGSKAKGLAKAEGDTITLIYEYGAESYPDDFTPDGPTQNMFVIKKAAAH